MLVDYTAEKEGLAGIERLIEEFKRKLYTEPLGTAGYDPVPARKNEGFMSSAQIQYVCRAGNFVKKRPYVSWRTACAACADGIRLSLDTGACEGRRLRLYV